MKKLSLNRVKAIRRIRAGLTVDHVCSTMGLPIDSVSNLEKACRAVPDDILADIEHVLIDYEKMRRLVADLVPTFSTAISPPPTVSPKIDPALNP